MHFKEVSIQLGRRGVEQAGTALNNCKTGVSALRVGMLRVG